MALEPDLMEPELIHDSSPPTNHPGLPGQRVRLSFTDRIRRFFLSKQEWEAYLLERERKRNSNSINQLSFSLHSLSLSLSLSLFIHIFSVFCPNLISIPYKFCLFIERM